MARNGNGNGHIKIGYALSSEEHQPKVLVENARAAEDLGFPFAMISDHYHPWIDAQGQSPFVWSVIGGIAAVTDKLELGTGVTCPIRRIHPAIIAQAAATAANMLGPDRFVLGLGSGEALNEHIIPEYWPEAPVRLEMLEESIALMRELWSGEERSFSGHYFEVEDARIYTMPEKPFPVVVAASGSKSAELAADNDGVVATMPDPDLPKAMGESAEKRKYGQVTVSWAPNEEEAKQNAIKYWPTSAVPGAIRWDLKKPSQFEAVVKAIPEEKVVEAIPCTSDAAPIIDKIQAFVDAGYDHIYVHNVGPIQQPFLEFAAREILPTFR